MLRSLVSQGVRPARRALRTIPVLGGTGSAVPRAGGFAHRALRMQSTTAAESTSDTLMKTAFSSNMAYVFFVVAGSATVTFAYSEVIDMMWRWNNKGKLYEDVDWSVFKEEEEEDDDDEDEDEDDDDE